MPLSQGSQFDFTQTTATDGNTYTVPQGRQTEQIVSELHGKYYQWAYRGRMFIGSSPIAGVAIPISSTTAPTPCIWNPLGSGVNVVLIRYTAAYTGGTGVVTGFGYYALTGAGATIGTAAPISAFAATTPTNAIIGGGLASKVKFSSTGTVTLTSAGTLVKAMNMGQAVTAATNTNLPQGGISEDFDGTLIIPPGVLFYTAGTAASGDTFAQSFVWYEAPI
jgi:hypothetical protein